jgi:hypothetical protein
MIVDERTYTVKPGAVAEYFKLYEQQALALQTKILGHLVGYFSTEIGTLNQIVHIWAYENFAEREKRRSELRASEKWQSYAATARPLVVQQENRILVPASFSPLR